MGSEGISVVERAEVVSWGERRGGRLFVFVEDLIVFSEEELIVIRNKGVHHV